MSINEHNIFLVLKMISGEEILCTFIEHGEDYIEIMYPMVVKTISYMKDGALQESVSLKPWSNFTDDPYYSIPFTGMFWFKDMHEVYQKHYISAVESATEEEEYSEEEITDVNELRTKVKSLSDSLGIDDSFQNIVEGNDTIN